MSGAATFALDDGVSRVVVAPGAGGALVSWTWRVGNARVPLLRAGPESPDPADPFALGCNLLLPWSNRISGGGFRFDGAHHPLGSNLPGEPFPIHGDAFQRPWTVAARDATSATLRLGGGETGPFRYVADVDYRLEDGALAIEVRAANEASVRLPYGGGMHPWFPRTPGTMLRLDAAEVRLEDARYLPAGRAALDAMPTWDFRAGAPLPAGWINNAFTGWDGAATLEWPLAELLRFGSGDDGRGPSGADGARVALRLAADPPLDVCIVHSPGRDASFVCVEPVSHPVDSHNDPDAPFEGLAALGPGESVAFGCRLEPSLRGWPTPTPATRAPIGSRRSDPGSIAGRRPRTSPRGRVATTRATG